MVIFEYIDIDKAILKNIDIDKEILENIDIDKISNQLEFGISNRATTEGEMLKAYLDIQLGPPLAACPGGEREFGQCPKENGFSSVRCSLSLQIKWNLFSGKTYWI